jgi:phosphoribosyl 1,2-cyclic phosphodiesterase
VHSFEENSFYIQDITVSPFLVQHDVHCVGYSLLSNTKQLSIATDMGQYTQGVLDAMSGSNLVFIESNYDEDMLKNGNYPTHLKRRVMSDFGHLSNTDCGSVIAKLTNMGTRQFVLSHLSQNNNYPELAFSSIVDTLDSNGIVEGKDVVVEVAEQHKLSSLFQL